MVGNAVGDGFGDATAKIVKRGMRLLIREMTDGDTDNNCSMGFVLEVVFGADEIDQSIELIKGLGERYDSTEKSHCTAS